MTTQSRVSLNLDKLEKLIKELGSDYVVKVGIIGADGGEIVDESGNLTMAALGLIHEFGTASGHIPPRSFLRMPLETKQDELIKGLKIAKKTNDAEDINAKEIMEKLGIAAEEVIQQAFDSSGFGQWAPNAPSTIRAKGSSSPLINKGRLRKSISSKVVKKADL